MEIMVVFIRFLFSIMFLSSAISKLKKLEYHRIIIQEYKILPPSLVKIFSRFDVLGELVIGTLFLLGLFHKTASALAILLLSIYSVAILVNLLRGNRNISCGCGGVVGNHKLSWWLVLRNLALILIAVWLYNSESILGSLDAFLSGVPISGTFNTEFLFITLSTCTTFLIIQSVRLLFSLQQRITKLFLEY